MVVSAGAWGLYFSAREGRPDGVPGTNDAERPEECGWQPTLPGPLLNTTGAGDALLAGLVHAHLSGAPLADAARVAAACAALTLATPSANHPDLSPALVAQWLDSHAQR